jgi:hypothetical protein
MLSASFAHNLTLFATKSSQTFTGWFNRTVVDERASKTVRADPVAELDAVAL